MRLQRHTTHGHVRHILLVLAATALAVAVLVLDGDRLVTDDQRARAQTASRPNFVFVMTDDLDKQSMHQLDGIRAMMGSNGTTFENAFVNYALCCPSRATILRGQYPHNHGITGSPTSLEPHFRELGEDQSTVATWLDKAGYQTKYVGKYMNDYRGPYIPPGWDEWFALSGDVDNNEVNDDGQSLTLAGNSTDAFATETSDFIRRSHANPAPFFVMVGTKAPHSPPEVPERYLNSFANASLPRPPNFDEVDVLDKPAWVKAFPRLTLDQITKEQTKYRQRLRSMLAVEDLLRQTIATLQETGEIDNTYIIFTSDNGFHQGQHRLVPGEKKTPYEEDIRIPLIVRGPGVPAGAIRKQMVINNDFAPTIATLAGVPIPTFVDGRSFTPLLAASPPSSWRTAFLEEGTWQPNVPPVPMNKGIRTTRYSYVEYDTGEHELYDLSTDPYQLDSKPQAGNEQLYSTLQTRLNALRDCSGAVCRANEWDTQVISTIPKANATAVPPTADVRAIFSEDMRASSITATTFKLVTLNFDGTTTNVTATVSYDAATEKAILNPSSDLSSGATYKATVTTGAQDLAGNALDQNPTLAGNQSKSWKFTVQ